MANYSREEAEKMGNAEVGTGIGVLTGLAALMIGGVVHSANKSKEKERKQERIQKIDRQIQEIDREIADYRTKLFGSALYADEISALERQRNELKKEREEL